MVGVIDYGMGNLLSVTNALEYLGEECMRCSAPTDIDKVDRIILPGVGAFNSCVENLERTGFITPLNHFALVDKKPIMGICLGMQVMAAKGFEFGEWNGLGWFDASVVRISEVDDTLKLPHIGWTDVAICKNSPMFVGLPKEPDFYFVHSYFMKFDGDEYVDAVYQTKAKITAAVRRHNIFGTQFHPEKSQDSGLRLLENFVRWQP